LQFFFAFGALLLKVLISVGAVMLSGWEGNCRFGVTLAVRHRL